MTNDSYLFLQLDIDPSASSGEPSSASHCPLEEIFQVTKPRWKTKQCTWVLTHNGKKTHMHACRRTVSHTHTSLFSTRHMEMSVPPKRCSLMSGHVAGMDPGHTYTLSSCVRDCRPTPVPPLLVYLPLPSPPGGKLIVSVIDCHGRSALSSG